MEIKCILSSRTPRTSQIKPQKKRYIALYPICEHCSWNISVKGRLQYRDEIDNISACAMGQYREVYGEQGNNARCLVGVLPGRELIVI